VTDSNTSQRYTADQLALMDALKSKNLTQWFSPLTDWVNRFAGLELFLADSSMPSLLAQVTKRLLMLDHFNHPTDVQVASVIALLEFNYWRIAITTVQSHRWNPVNESLSDYLCRSTAVWEYEQTVGEFEEIAAAILELKKTSVSSE